MANKILFLENPKDKDQFMDTCILRLQQIINEVDKENSIVTSYLIKLIKAVEAENKAKQNAAP